MTDEDDTALYRVVVNEEEQYSIWPAELETPTGWRVDGEPGSKEDCLRSISQVWTDMRPLSLRRLMDAGSHGQGN